jgi:hypothetical protein
LLQHHGGQLKALHALQYTQINAPLPVWTHNPASPSPYHTQPSPILSRTCTVHENTTMPLYRVLLLQRTPPLKPHCPTQHPSTAPYFYKQGTQLRWRGPCQTQTTDIWYKAASQWLQHELGKSQKVIQYLCINGSEGLLLVAHYTAPQSPTNSTTHALWVVVQQSKADLACAGC